MRVFSLVVLLCGAFRAVAVAESKDRHVVVIVWDGMRRDFITEKLAPTLHALAQRGVFFQNHHPVFLSTTEVNGTALATGAYPEHSHIIANQEFRYGISTNKPVGTESLDAIRKGDRLIGGHYLEVPTVAEILQAHGLRTVVAGSKPVALLQDRSERTNFNGGAVLFEGRTLPPALQATLTNALGLFPPTSVTKTNRDNWTTRALVEELWRDGVPSFTLLWLAEPDYSQHGTSPGSEQSLASIRNSDRNLARVIEALKSKGVYDQTDIFVVSDHGFSTVGHGVDVAAVLNKNGFNAVRQYENKPAPGEILIVNGATTLLYVAGHDPETSARLVRFLQTQEFTGVIFSRQSMEGAFALEDAHINSPEAPDVVFTMRWTHTRNRSGTAGMENIEAETPIVDGQAKATPQESKSEKGTHGTLSPYDLRNTLVAAGPDFRAGFADRLPSGNTDVAPTVLWLLGIEPPRSMDGRVLSEALNIDGPKTAAPKSEKLEASRHDGRLIWRQYLKRTELNGMVYLDEGNGEVSGP